MARNVRGRGIWGRISGFILDQLLGHVAGPVLTAIGLGSLGSYLGGLSPLGWVIVLLFFGLAGLYAYSWAQEFALRRLRLEREEGARNTSGHAVHFEITSGSELNVTRTEFEGNALFSVVIWLEMEIDNASGETRTVRWIDFDIIDPLRQKPALALGPCLRPTAFYRESGFGSVLPPDLDSRGLDVPSGARGRAVYYASTSRDLDGESALARLDRRHVVRIRASVMGQTDLIVDLAPEQWPVAAGDKTTLVVVAP